MLPIVAPQHFALGQTVARPQPVSNGMKKIKLKTALFLTIALAGLIGASGVLYFYLSVEKILTDKSIDLLITAAESRADHINTFLDGKKNIVAEFSSDTFIREQLILLKNEGNYADIGDTLSQYLLLNKIVIDRDIYEVVVLDAKGIIVGESNPEADKVGEDRSDSELFLKGKVRPFISDIFYDEEFNRNAYAASAPIRPRGVFLGVIVIEMGLETLFRITTDRTGLGKTGEIYIISEENYLLTPSRFLSGENKGILTQVVDTENSKKCFKGIGRSGVFDDEELTEHSKVSEEIIFKNYRGETTLGVHSHMVSQSWCLIAEIDKSEALSAPRQKLLLVSLFILFATSLLYVSLMYFTRRLFDKNEARSY